MKKMMFVDDQWCRRGNESILLAEYGGLLQEGYEFSYETAFDGYKYNVNKVLDRINEQGPFYAVVSDMNFNAERNSEEGKYFGKTLLSTLKQENPKLQVIMHSSITNKDLVNECLRLGAKKYLEKKATYKELKESLEG